MAALDCVINHTKLTYDENYYDIGRNSVRLTFSLPYPHTWDFFENGDWVQKGDVSARGRWVCDGDRDYKITNTLGEVFSSKIAVWLSSPKSDPKFYCVSNAAYHAEIFKNVKKLRGQNSLTILNQKGTWIFNADKTFLGKSGENAEGHSYGGTWKCLGNNTFEIIDKESGEKWIDNGKGWTDINPAVDCVRKSMIDAGYEFDILPDSIVQKNTSEGKYRYFYNNNVYLLMMKEGNNFVRKDTGTWECDGERNYKIFSKTNSKTYSSKTGQLTDTIPAATTTTKPKANDSFPLREGSEGPNVVKLQKFLNDKIPSNPLTVNGRFDEKTKNKLIEYQKKEGII